MAQKEGPGSKRKVQDTDVGGPVPTPLPGPLPPHPSLPDLSLVRWKPAQLSSALPVFPMGRSRKGEGDTIRNVSQAASQPVPLSQAGQPSVLIQAAGK